MLFYFYHIYYQLNVLTLDLLLFQKTLKMFFPNVHSLIKQRQVLLLIIGLMPDPTQVIQSYFLCMSTGYRWTDGQKSAAKVLIEAMFREAGLPVPKNLLHNQWINYYDHQDSLFNDTTPVYIPSRMYWFNDLKSSVNIYHGEMEIPECIIWISYPTEAVVNRLFAICQNISLSQKITNLYLKRVNYQHLPDNTDPEVFNMSKTAQSVTLEHCVLPSQILDNLMQQISKSNYISAVGIKEIDSNTVYVESMIARFTSEDEMSFFLRNCNLTSKLQALYNPLTHTHHMNRIDICELTDSTMPIETLNHLIKQIFGRKMEMKNVEPINDKIVKVGEFSFEKSRDCSMIIFEHCTTPSLALNCLTQVANQYNMIKYLRLPHFTLTGCLSSFIPDSHPGLPQLKELRLMNTGINKDDLQHLSHITHSNKLPKTTVP